MAKNVKPLTDDELSFIKNNYVFDLRDEYIIVSKKDYNRKVLHEFNECFDLNTSVRKIRINPDAMKYWAENFKDKYTLVEVQNAINILSITYQKVNLENLVSQLEKGCIKINSFSNK